MENAKETIQIDDIYVNGFHISNDDVGKETQHHPADNAREAAIKAAEALVIKALLLTKAKQESLVDGELSELDEKIQESAIEKLIENNVEFPNASDDECEHFFNANQRMFRSPDLVEANHILLAAAPDDTVERINQKDKAIALIKQIQNNEAGFAIVARDHSACPSKEMGGNLGQLTKGSTVPEFESRVFMLDQGLCADPIETRYGFHIVDIARKVEGENLPFEAVQNRVSDYLNHQVYRRAVSQYIQILAGEAEIEGFDMDAADSPLVQ